jgi:hypothetical protein
MATDLKLFGDLDFGVIAGNATVRAPSSDRHIKPDLILIYRKPDDDSLELVRLGSHSELGL